MCECGPGRPLCFMCFMFELRQDMKHNAEEVTERTRSSTKEALRLYTARVGHILDEREEAQEVAMRLEACADDVRLAVSAGVEEHTRLINRLFNMALVRYAEHEDRLRK